MSEKHNQASRIITFPSIHDALKAEKHCRKAGFKVKLIPVPRHISSNCGMALECLNRDIEEIMRGIRHAELVIDSLHSY